MGPSFLPPFSLQRLHMRSSKTPIPRSLCNAIFQPSLEHLRIDGPSLQYFIDLRNSFVAIAPHLRSLNLLSLPPPSMDHIYVDCVTLSHLEVFLMSADGEDRPLSLFDAFPLDTIKNLTIASYSRDPWTTLAILDCLLGIPSLQRVARLSVTHSCSRSELLEEVEGEDLLRVTIDLSWNSFGVLRG